MKLKKFVEKVKSVDYKTLLAMYAKEYNGKRRKKRIEAILAEVIESELVNNGYDHNSDTDVWYNVRETRAKQAKQG